MKNKTVSHTQHIQSDDVNSLFDLFLQKMQHVQSMTFESKSQAGSSMGWSGRAQASVTTQVEKQVPQEHEHEQGCELHEHRHLENTVLKLYEKGFFYPNSSTSSPKPLPFSNCFKLVFKPEKIAFYHERFGVAHAVWLFDLVADADETLLVSQQPHLCGKDTYLVKVSMLKEGDVEMQWQIKGPQKNERLFYHYSTKQL